MSWLSESENYLIVLEKVDIPAGYSVLYDDARRMARVIRELVKYARYLEKHAVNDEYIVTKLREGVLDSPDAKEVLDDLAG